MPSHTTSPSPLLQPKPGALNLAPASYTSGPEVRPYESGSTDSSRYSGSPQPTSPPPRIPPRPDPLNLEHAESSYDTNAKPKHESYDLLQGQSPYASTINARFDSPSSPSLAASLDVSTPLEYSTFFNRHSGSPGRSNTPSSQRKPVHESRLADITLGEFSIELSGDADRTHSNASPLQRTPSAADVSTTSSIHRTSSASSYQPSLITPCTTSQSTPELYGSKMELNNADWQTFYNVDDVFMATLGTPTITLQNEIHNLIVTEENYVVNTRIFLDVFGNGLADTLEKGREKFRQDAFETLQVVVDINERLLLKPLKADQERNGPILQFQPHAVKEWVTAIKEPILSYARRHPYASEVVQIQKTSNERFKAFIDHGSAETTKAVRKEFSSLFENTRTRFGQYHMIFGAILKQMKKVDGEDPIIAEVEECIEMCRATLSKYNEIQGEVGTRLEMARLQRSLKFKYHEDKIDLGLNDEGHEIVYRGKVKLKHDVEIANHEMILLDHFLLLGNATNTSYVVTSKPIHLELLVIESVSDDPMFKSNAMAVVSKLTRNKSEAGPQYSNRQNSVISTASAPAAPQVGSLSGASSPYSQRHKSSGSISAYTPDLSSVSLSHNNNLIYPIKLRNLATDQKYYVCTTSEITRKEWVKKICEAKAAYSRKAFELSLEPLSMRIIDSSSFAYNPIDMPKGSIFPKDNALYRALNEHKQTVAKLPPPLVSTQTNSSVASSSTLTPIVSGGITPPTNVVSSRMAASGIKSTSSIYCAADVVYNNMRMLFLGMSDAIYACQIQHSDSPLKWVLIDRLARVTQIEAVEEKNMLFVLSEKTLFLYKFNEIILSILTHGSIQSNTKVTVSPPTLMDQNVDCFKSGMLSNIPSLFYSVYGNKSTVTVLEITGKEQRKKSGRLFGFKNKSHGNEFKESDWLFTPTRNREITFFNSTFCIHTDNSFEVMNLERKQPCSIPTEASILHIAKKCGLNEGQAENMRRRLTEAKPISIDKVPSRAVGPRGVSVGNDFLLCYHKFAIMCDALGDLETSVTINYLHKISAAHVWYPYLVTFSDRVIEIHKLTRGANVHQLVQVVTGRNIRMLEYTEGEKQPRLIFTMAHPEQRQRQLILEFVLNDRIEQDQSHNSLSCLTQR